MSHAADHGDPFAADPDMNDHADWRETTITSFPAITDATPEPAWVPDDIRDLDAATDRPCPCGSGKPLRACSGREVPDLPGKEALLSCAPGVTGRMWRTRIANGQWDDIPSLWDDAHAEVHKPAFRQARHIHAVLGARRHDIATVLARRPDLLTDRVLAEGLHDLEATLAARLAGMQAAAAAREAAA